MKGEQGSVLLVDDEPAYHAIVRAILSEAGLLVHAVSDAPSAFQALRVERYALILMDIEMAGISGFRGAAHIRSATDWTRTVPIVAFTTLAPPDGESFFRRRGFDGWLPKPFRSIDLTRLIGAMLGDEAIHSDGAGSRRLSALLGAEQAGAMRQRFVVSLADAVISIDGGTDPGPQAHRIAGLAGTLGMPTLSAAWLELYRGKRAAWPTVRTLTLEVIDAARAVDSNPA